MTHVPRTPLMYAVRAGVCPAVVPLAEVFVCSVTSPSLSLSPHSWFTRNC